MNKYGLVKIHSIQYLRAVAALAVVIFHMETRVLKIGYAGYWPTWLKSGVDIFFVISGFIMVVIILNSQKSSLSFFVDRVVRIVPLYWVWTTLAAILSGSLTWHVAASYLFLPWPHPTADEMWPILIPGWTLNYEMFFYALISIWLTFSRKYFLQITAISLLLLHFIGTHIDNRLVSFYSNSIILEFVAGMIVGLFWYNQKLKSHWVLLPVGFLLLPLLPQSIEFRFYVYGLPATLILMGALAVEKHVKPIWLLIFLGNASYSIYLAHGFALSACYILAIKFGAPWQVFVIGSFLGAIILGGMSFYFLEKPLLAAGKSIKKSFTSKAL